MFKSTAVSEQNSETSTTLACLIGSYFAVIKTWRKKWLFTF